MKCPKCGTLTTKADQKFCTQCGCSLNGESGAEKRRTYVEERRTENVKRGTAEDIEFVRGRAIWQIEKGEIARRITESELLAADELKGVIVPQGCSALVFIDGILMAEMSSGIYTFPKEEEVKTGFFRKVGHAVMRFLFGRRKDETDEQHQLRVKQRQQKLQGIEGPHVFSVCLVSDRAIDLVVDGVAGRDGAMEFRPFRVKTSHTDVDMGVSLQLQVSNIKEFATNYLSDSVSFTSRQLLELIAPRVRSAVEREIRGYNYSATGIDAQMIKVVKHAVAYAANEMLHGIEVVSVLDITDRSEDFDRFHAVERELFATEQEIGFLHRTGEFRNLMEQESNRQKIASARNDQELREAMQEINKADLLSADEMDRFIMAVKAEKRLRDSLDRQNEAGLQEAEYEALADLRKSRMMKDDDIAALENKLQQGRINRDNVTDIIRIQAMQKTQVAEQIVRFTLSDNEEDHAMARKLKQLRAQGEFIAVDIENRRVVDRYNDERDEFEWQRDFNRRAETDKYNLAFDEQKWQLDYNKAVQMNNLQWQLQLLQEKLNMLKEDRAHDRARQDKFDEIEILKQKSDIAMRNMDMIQKNELAKQQAQQQHEQEMENIRQLTDRMRIQAEQGMSAEQIAAAHMDEIAALTPEAQQEMARMMGSGNAVRAEMLEQQNEMTKQLYEKMLAMQQQNQQGQLASQYQNSQQLMQMAQLMMAGMMQLGANSASMHDESVRQQINFMEQRLDDQRQLKDEYRDNMHHQQQRMDANTDLSFNYTLGAKNINAGNAESRNRNNPSLGEIFSGAPKSPEASAPRKCSSCGAVITDDSNFCPDCGKRV